MVEARILEKGCFPFWGLIDIFLLYRTLIRHEYSFTQGPVMTLGMVSIFSAFPML